MCRHPCAFYHTLVEGTGHTSSLSTRSRHGSRRRRRDPTADMRCDNRSPQCPERRASPRPGSPRPQRPDGDERQSGAARPQTTRRERRGDASSTGKAYMGYHDTSRGACRVSVSFKTQRTDAQCLLFSSIFDMWSKPPPTLLQWNFYASRHAKRYSRACRACRVSLCLVPGLSPLTSPRASPRGKSVQPLSCPSRPSIVHAVSRHMCRAGTRNPTTGRECC